MNIKKILLDEYQRREKQAKEKIPKFVSEINELESKKETLEEFETKEKSLISGIQSQIQDSQGELKKSQLYLEEVRNQAAKNSIITKFDAIKSLFMPMLSEKEKQLVVGAPQPHTPTGKIFADEQDLLSLPLKERKQTLRKLNFTKRITDTPLVFVKGKEAVKKAILKMSNMKGSEGAVLKDLSSPYSFGETKKSWIKFRKLTDLHVMVIERVAKKKGLFNYLVGIDLREKDLKTINPAKIRESGTRKLLVLGHTFNTKEKVDDNKIIDIMIEEIWRHETKKGIHYSIHKPRFRQVRSDLTATSTIDDLEDIVTSIGVAVKGFSFAAKDIEKAKKTFKNWPDWIQSGLRLSMEKNIWLPFVIQHHYRGTTSDEKDKYKYNLRSIHSDYRQFIPKNIDKMKENTVVKYEDAKEMPGICYGITVNTPPSVDKSDEWDNNVKHVLCEGKLPIPKGWLFVEGIADINEPGSSWYGGRSIAPGVLVIAGYGEVLPTEVTDHIIKLKFRSSTGNKNMKVFDEADKKGILIENKFSNNLKNLEGEFEFTINHIGDKWLIFLNKVNLKGRKQTVTKEMMNQIFTLTQIDYSRKQIADDIGVSLGTVYNYQKMMGLI